MFRVFCLVFVFSASVVRSGESPAISRELHWAVTGEKFELALERWRSKTGARRGLPVVLAHGLLVNSVFLNLDEEHSLARFLAEEGFDVWNLSLRGTGRSLNPLGGGPTRWSLDDMIKRDVPAVIRYVLKETHRRRLFWVGYDAGGLLLYGYLEKRGGAGLAGGITIGAPVAFNHARQEAIKKLLYLDESPLLKKLFLYLNGPFLERLLLPLVPALQRLFYNPENMEAEILDRLLESALAEINPGVLDHLLLMIKRGEFISASGDYSYRKNLSRIRLPLLLIGGEGDDLAPPDAIREAYRRTGSADRTVRIFGPRAKDSVAYGHFDLIVGEKARAEVYPVIGKWLKQREERG